MSIEKQTLSPERKPHCFRSAGACPPRSLKQNEKRPQPRGHGRFLLRPGHGEGQAHALRGPSGSPQTKHCSPPSRYNLANRANLENPASEFQRKRSFLKFLL